MGIGPVPISPPQQNGSFNQLLPLIKTVIKLGCSHHIDAEEPPRCWHRSASAIPAAPPGSSKVHQETL